MTILDIILLSIGLAMDCFSVSIIAGIDNKQNNISTIMRMPVLFGFFQGFMPLLGILVSIPFASFINSYNHWFALIILSILGGKMIISEIKHKESESGKNFFKWGTVILLAITTSIDAFSIGLILDRETAKIISALLIIAAGSFIFSCIGLYIGHVIGKKMLNVKIGILGGIILILIGLKIFLEH